MATSGKVGRRPWPRGSATNRRDVQPNRSLLNRGVDAKPDPVERAQVGDVDAELGVAAEVPGVEALKVNVQQAQGLSRFLCSSILLPAGET